MRTLHDDLKRAIPHPKKRRKAIREVISKTVEAVVATRKQTPNWQGKALLTCLGNHLHSLKTLIENPEEVEVTWDSPWMETRYPVTVKPGPDGQWGESATDVSPILPYHFRQSPEEMDKLLQEGLEEVIVSGLYRVEYDIFKNLTRKLAYLKQGDSVDHIIPKAVYGDMADAMTKQMEGMDEDRRASYVGVTDDILFQPFTLVLGDGGGWIEDLRRERATDEMEKALGYSPLVHGGGSITGTDDDGTPFSLSAIMEIHPLFVELDADGQLLQAYYPVTTGLIIEPETVNPGKWSKEDQEALWEEIFALVYRLIEDRDKEGVSGEEETPAPGGEARSLPPSQEEQGETFTDENGDPALPLTEEDYRQLDKQFTDFLKKEETSGPVKTIFPMFLSGTARMDRQVAEMLSHAHHVKLPTRWSTIRRWEDIEKQEILDILAEEGDRAFEDLRSLTSNPDARGPLLETRYKPGGESYTVLSPDAKRNLRRRAGLQQSGFIEVDGGDEYYVRLYETGRGHLEIGLSWNGLAGPLVEEWRNQKLDEAELRRQSPLLWDQLDDAERRRVDHKVEQASLFNAGARIMDAIVSQVSTQKTNPIYIPAEGFRALLWPENREKNIPYPSNWKRKVEDILQLLRTLNWKWKAQGESLHGKGYGSFLGSWNYIGRGPGGHGNGNYILDVQPEFLGCISVFSNGKKRLRDGREAVYFDFGKKPSKDELTGYITFDAGRPFYNAAAGFTPHQDRLSRFIEGNLTRKNDPARKENRHRKPHSKEDGNSYRGYDRTFCPLLSEGGVYWGALGHFKRNPETGFTLGGTGSRLSRHTEGLMSVMGYILPFGRSTARKGRIISEALQDLKVVVEEAYGGIVAGRIGGDWYSLGQFKDLGEKQLCYNLRIYCFIPEDYQRARREGWEKAGNYQSAQTLEEAEMAAWGDLDEVLLEHDNTSPSVDNDFRGLPLRDRLQEVMRRREVSGAALGELFGVSKMTVSNWLTGRKPIPRGAAPLLLRWIETETPPTAEELAARRTHKVRT